MITNGSNGKELVPGRVVAEYRGLYKVMTEEGEYYNAIITGKMYYESEDEAQMPTVGDYVGLDISGGGNAVLRRILPRKSVFIRKAAGPETRSQTLASNFDYVFIITSMNYDFNIARLDRYVSMAWDSGGIPVIILSKADLVEDRDPIIEELVSNYPGVEFHMTSNITGEGMEELKKYFMNGQTVAFMGSSGVGKSSLLNYLNGEEIMEVNELRGNIDKGQHTTTHRQLITIPGGGSIIDTPGMRELGLWHSGEGIDKGFEFMHAKIEELSGHCRFSDCSHVKEPGCAVMDAIKMGEISSEQYERYKKLQKEARRMEVKINSKARFEENNKRKAFAREMRNKKKVQW
ncbi:MAG: ribosome small subunit-dependent GTPase A [Clostridia bacterium]|nr:ribosome small subunit-dependent GTPase A [Clostridia bacterium]